MDLDARLERIQAEVRERFETSERVLSFDEFLEDFYDRPAFHLRTAPQYLVEMFDFFGARESSRVGQESQRFQLFDIEPDGTGGDVLFGQERVQNAVYQYLSSFAVRGKADKMLLLHGPNGSGKTTVVEAIMRALEIFSKEPEGAIYTFNWIFTEREGRLDRIGFDPDGLAAEDDATSYAHLEPKDVTARISCELRDAPILLIPAEVRAAIIREALAEKPRSAYPDQRFDFFEQNDLCQKCRKIYDSALVAYQGDWRKVVRHVQVVRFEISKRYRTAAVSIEPQGNVDAGARPILTDHSYSIPPMLKNQILYEPVGDIIDANRGVLEYSDFLKRPLETNKYLLTTCERGTVSLGNCMAFLDQVIFATANEKQLSVFKRSPDFSSFKARMELIGVPYLLRFSAEADLYRRHIRLFSRGRHLAPHTAKVAALWAVLTRLRRPIPSSYEDTLGDIVGAMTPLEKAKLYDGAAVPDRLSEDEKKLLRSSILRIRQEFEESEADFEGIYGAEYEGRRGVSPREMMSVLARAAGENRHECLTPMAVFDTLEDLIRDTSLYDFLRLTPDHGYRDPRALLEDVRMEHLAWVTDEVYRSISLIDESEYDRVFLEYFRHVKAFDAGEQVFHPSTGSYAPPDEARMQSIEDKVGISEEPADWRSNIMLRIAAWSLDHDGEAIDYHRLFPEIYKALRDNFYRERNRLLTLIEQDMLKYGTDEFDLLSPAEQKTVTDALETMEGKYRYCRSCARDVIAYVLTMRSRLGIEEDSSAPVSTS